MPLFSMKMYLFFTGVIVEIIWCWIILILECLLYILNHKYLSTLLQVIDLFFHLTIWIVWLSNIFMLSWVWLNAFSYLNIIWYLLFCQGGIDFISHRIYIWVILSLSILKWTKFFIVSLCFDIFWYNLY